VEFFTNRKKWFPFNSSPWSCRFHSWFGNRAPGRYNWCGFHHVKNITWRPDFIFKI